MTTATHTRGSIRIASTLIVVAALTGATVACSPSSPSTDRLDETAADDELRELLPKEIQESGEVIVGGTFDNPPVLYLDAGASADPKGVAPDLSVLLGDVLGIDFVWRNTQWAGQLPGLDSGALGIAWGQATVTAEREETLYDMIPFYSAPLAVLVKAGNPKEITSFESMCGAVIGTGVGTIFDYYISLANEQLCTPAGKPAITTLAYAQAEEVGLQSGQVDAIIDSFPVLDASSQTIPDTEAVKLSDAEKFDSGLAGITFAKSNGQLATAVAAALQKLYDDGSYAKVMDDNGVPAAALDRDQLVVNYLTGTPAGETR